MVRLKGVKTVRVSLEAFDPESRDVESRDENFNQITCSVAHRSSEIVFPKYKAHRQHRAGYPPNFDNFRRV